MAFPATTRFALAHVAPFPAPLRSRFAAAAEVVVGAAGRADRCERICQHAPMVEIAAIAFVVTIWPGLPAPPTSCRNPGPKVFRETMAGSIIVSTMMVGDSILGNGKGRPLAD